MTPQFKYFNDTSTQSVLINKIHNCTDKMSQCKSFLSILVCYIAFCTILTTWIRYPFSPNPIQYVFSKERKHMQQRFGSISSWSFHFSFALHLLHHDLVVHFNERVLLSTFINYSSLLIEGLAVTVIRFA